MEAFRKKNLNFVVAPDVFYMSFTKIVEVFRETGSVAHKKEAERPSLCTEQVVADV